MNISFVSDNFYLCTGIESQLFDSHQITCKHDIDMYLQAYNPENYLVVGIENLFLRDYFIKTVKRLNVKYMILMQDIIKDHCFKIGDVVFSSLECSPHYIQKIVRYFPKPRQNVLTQRELDILDVFHLQNVKIARELDISQKTASGHRVNIQHKLRMKSKNTLAMLRIKTAISRSNGSQLHGLLTH
ncbi:LuxR C-terminal-related transcriptional regulator [Scandinavium sp. V105_16]|uniref:LuxR C-terminal-related transcriptional regulator n=1 Tax=Scandinavium lactucae TaxID=3095028 RepID=A0AAJ2S6A7_9ENTR|nr:MULTISPECIES: LuxR C-terminal-related transcriptional regulator [unclassified Scandinavium]MDX6019346.1 LuxR C-terminal-related transcriptional regulator [Scandinavium sp. V105_16]MDX6030498.1 LuxR C-terminal-related transcriptional regulator [Scandinavium sp. V105_12]MDX6039464.1 LuxR C-terminal-related transcriptional regulator [Scandinavium sp. V105_6]MDX6048926.1 LuxR C-terminal-related transcriptional regulator [Scandinavium sp. V105_1]